MHIGFLTPEYPHPKTGNSGGLGTSIKNLVRGLQASGHRVSIVVYGQKADEVIQEEGLALHLLRNKKIKGFSRWLTQKKIQKYLNDLVSTQDLQVVEAPDWTGITSNIRLKCPVIVRLHGSDTYFCHLDGRRVKFRNRWHEKRALQSADALLSVSAYTAQVTRELFRLDRDFTVVPNGVDTNQFQPADKSEQVHTLLYFGTLIRKKGLLELPHIFNAVIAENPQARLLLVGKDSADIATQSSSTWALMQPLFTPEALAATTWLGAVAYTEMENQIASANVCVFPSFAEALPVSWIEAMAMRKAIVASDRGWAPEIVTDGDDGFLVNPTAHTAYAQRINLLLNDDRLRQEMARAARKKAEARFSLPVVTARNEDFYERIIRQYKR